MAHADGSILDASCRSSGQPVKGWPDCNSLPERSAYCRDQQYKGQRTDILTGLLSTPLLSSGTARSLRLAAVAHYFNFNCKSEGMLTVCAAVLANAAYRRQAVQEQVLKLGGVKLVLAHCQVLHFLPYI